MSEFFSDEEARFRMEACLKKMLGKPLSEVEREVVRDVNRRNGWDRGPKASPDPSIRSNPDGE